MASVIHRVTKAFRASVNTPDFSAADYIINPDMTAVEGQPERYRVITGDVVSLMSLAEQNTVDSAIAESGKDSVADTIDSDKYLRAFALVMLDELNARADKINSILDAIDGANNLSSLKGSIGTIADHPQRTKAQLKTAVRGKL